MCQLYVGVYTIFHILMHFCAFNYCIIIIFTTKYSSMPLSVFGKSNIPNRDAFGGQVHKKEGLIRPTFMVQYFVLRTKKKKSSTVPSLNKSSTRTCIQHSTIMYKYDAISIPLSFLLHLPLILFLTCLFM